MIDVFSLEITMSALALGVIVGMTYGALAVGLILVYRSSGVINFAHGAIGALGAAVLGIAVTQWGFPYWIAMVAAIAVSGATGAITEMTVIRRLRKAPPMMSVVATLGVAQFLLLLTLSINNQVTAGRTFPKPPFVPTFDVGALRVTSSFSAMLLLTPVFVGVLVVFLRRTWFGLAIRGVAENQESARLAGIFPGRMSSLSWALAGAVAGFTAVLLIPTRGFITPEFFGPGLLLRALVPALIARMYSLPWALAGGIAVGVVEQVVFWNYSSGVADVALLVIVITTLLLNPQRPGRTEQKGIWTAVQPWRPLPDDLKRIWEIRNLSFIVGSVGLLLLLALPLVMTNSAAIIMTAIMSFALVGLSIGVITGLGGQLSLGQFALAGVGAAVAFHVNSATGNHLLAFLVAALGRGRRLGGRGVTGAAHTRADARRDDTVVRPCGSELVVPPILDARRRCRAGSRRDRRSGPGHRQEVLHFLSGRVRRGVRRRAETSGGRAYPAGWLPCVTMRVQPAHSRFRPHR